MPNPKYFTHFPEKDVSFYGISHKVKNLNRYIRISPEVIESKYSFYNYVITDGERPDHVSYKHYGDSKYYWIILVVNNIRDIWREWPMSVRELESYIASTYGSVSAAQSTIYQYVSNEGVVIDEETATSLPEGEYTIKTLYDFEDAKNEAKRSIKIIQPQYLSQFQSDIEKVFSEGG